MYIYIYSNPPPPSQGKKNKKARYLEETFAPMSFCRSLACQLIQLQIQAP